MNWTNFIHSATDVIRLAKSLLLPEWYGLLVLIALTLPFIFRAVRQINHARAELKKELELLDGCEQSLQALRSEGKKPNEVHFEQWLEGVPPESSVRKCIQTVWATRLIPNPDLEAISSMLNQNETARLSGVRPTPNILMLTGLIGTVLGLAGSVSQLGPQIQATLQSADPRALTASLSSTLGHMTSAFSCTFWGILGAVCIAHMISEVSKQQSDFTARLQEFGLRKLAPLVIPPSTAAQIEDVKSILQSSQDFMGEVSRMMTRAVQSFHQVLESASHAMTESVEKLQGVAGEIHHSLVDVSDNVLESARTLQSSSDRLQGCHADLQSAYKAMEGFFKNSKQQLEEQSREQLTKMGELQESFAVSAQEVVASINGSADDLEGATRAFINAGKDFETASDAIRQKLDTGFEKLESSIKEALEKHNWEMSQVDNHLNHIAERMSELANRLDPRLLPQGEWEAVRDSLERCARTLENVVAMSSDEAVRSGQSSVAAIGAIQETTIAGPELQRTLEKLQQGFERLADNLEELPRKLSEIQSISSERDHIMVNALQSPAQKIDRRRDSSPGLQSAQREHSIHGDGDSGKDRHKGLIKSITHYLDHLFGRR